MKLLSLDLNFYMSGIFIGFLISLAEKWNQLLPFLNQKDFMTIHFRCYEVLLINILLGQWGNNLCIEESEILCI